MAVATIVFEIGCRMATRQQSQDAGECIAIGLERRCPLLALSGHAELHCTCPLSGGKADMAYCSADVCF
jgi:hypothetical protein